MCPTMGVTKENEDGALEIQYDKGVKRLWERGVSKVPNKYIMPVEERAHPSSHAEPSLPNGSLKLPVIDFAELHGPNRPQVLKSLSNAFEQYGFFQMVNHGIPSDVVSGMIDVSKRFFELPYEERLKYMSSDLRAPVRYGTSFNQNQDFVFCWRDFLKLTCQPLPDVLPHWPSSPVDLRKLAATYAEETKNLFLMIMEAILESLQLGTTKRKMENKEEEEEEEIMKEFEDGSHLMIVNCFPPCPEPDLTLGFPPHSDYGFLTLLLQDEVAGLQIQHKEKWVTVEPIANAFVVNAGDHLEIFSNGKYRSVLHRVVVNVERPRMSVASLHSLPFARMVRPWPKLVDDENPRRYKDTDFESFLKYISSCDSKNKNFLESRKLF